MLVVAQKIVSKAEGRHVDLAKVRPSPQAEKLAAEVDKDPRLVEVILGESRRVVRHRPGVLIVEHRLGFIMANAGVDRSNVEPQAGAEPVLLLPRDPDAAAASLRERLIAHFRKTFPRSRLGVIVTDSWGRAWRRGTVGVALGVAGLPALMDMRGKPDLFGHELRVTQTGFADEIASAASLVMGQADEARPAVLVRGLSWAEPPGTRHRFDPRGGRGPVPVSRSHSEKALVVALSGGIGGAKLALGLSRVMPPADLVVVGQYRRRFRAPRPGDLARSRHHHVYACRPRRTRNAAGAGARRPGPSWLRSRRSAETPGSNSATATSPPMSSARGGSPAAKACPRSPKISARAWELRHGCCR